MSFPLLTNSAELKSMLEYSKEGKVLIFKHSTACPISAGALEELKKFSQTKESSDIKIGVVHVIEDRPVSNEIAEMFEIRHQSPQALLIEDQQVTWHDSHWNITLESLTKAVNH